MAKKIYSQLTIDEVINFDKNKQPIKQVLIINGSGGVGKDTFVSTLGKYISVVHESIINPVKDIAHDAGWNGDKTEKGRAFLSALKIAMGEYNDYPYTCMEKVVNWFKTTDNEILCIDMREPEDITRAKQEFNAKTVLVMRPSVKQIKTNKADAGVYDIGYDYIVDNSSDSEHLQEEVELFLRKLKGDLWKEQ